MFCFFSKLAKKAFTRTHQSFHKLWLDLLWLILFLCKKHFIKQICTCTCFYSIYWVATFNLFRSILDMLELSPNGYWLRSIWDFLNSYLWNFTSSKIPESLEWPPSIMLAFFLAGTFAVTPQRFICLLNTANFLFFPSCEPSRTISAHFFHLNAYILGYIYWYYASILVVCICTTK